MSNELAVATIGLISAVVLAVIGLLTKQHAKAAQKAAEDSSDAVNHRHLNGTPRLYDIVLDVSQKVDYLMRWREEWQSLPSNIADGDGLSHKLEKLEAGQDRIRDDVNDLRAELRDHVEWEMKHPATGRTP
jgi:hypothetical protein